MQRGMKKGGEVAIEGSYFIKSAALVPVASVGAHMRFESATLCCTVPTTRDLTGVRALPCMGEHMPMEMVALCCTVATPRDLTGEGALSRVAAHMRLETVIPFCNMPTPRHSTRMSLIHSQYLR